jgi:hypothetical protein
MQLCLHSGKHRSAKLEETRICHQAEEMATVELFLDESGYTGPEAAALPKVLWVQYPSYLLPDVTGS